METGMDIMDAAQTLANLQHRIDKRLNDARFDRVLAAGLYRLHGRYYEHFTLADLMARYAVLLRQMAYLIDEHRDIPPAHCGFISSWWWMGRLVHIQEEFRLRQADIPPLPVELASLGEPAPLIPPPAHGTEGFIVRYGQMQHLKGLMDIGRIRLAPASTYDDGSLGDARQDTEMTKSHFKDGNKMSVTTSGGDKIPVLGAMTFSTTLPDYHLSCWAREHDPRLFKDFADRDGRPAEACVIVWDVDAFAQRLAAAIGGPGEHFHHLGVEYYDAHRLEPGQRVDAGFSKELRYAYQREYRFLHLSGSKGQLAAKFVDVGSLNDIATLLTAEGDHLAGRPLPAGS
jgi:hypothetical protein